MIADAPPAIVEKFANLPYVADGNDAHRLDFYVPHGIADAPIVVFVHGGAFMYGDRRDYAWVGQALARQHLATAVVSYRLWPQADAGGASHDVAAATAWIVAHAGDYGLRSRNVFLAGHSSGAQIVAIVATDPQYLTAAGSSQSAIRGAFALAGAYDVRDLSGEPDDWQTIDGHIYGKTSAERSVYSPQVHVGAATPPIETACGTLDDPWSCDRAIAFAATLRADGIPAWAFKEIGADHMGMLHALVSPRDPLNAEFFDFVTKLEQP